MGKPETFWRTDDLELKVVCWLSRSAGPFRGKLTRSIVIPVLRGTCGVMPDGVWQCEFVNETAFDGRPRETAMPLSLSTPTKSVCYTAELKWRTAHYRKAALERTRNIAKAVLS